jgi:hypothetical protein
MRILAASPSADLDLTNTGEDRPAGVHLSDILSRMAWEREKKYNPDDPKDYMIFEQGHTWETVLSRALSARHTRPGYRPEPLQEDGIWMSPDWINPDASIQVEEWKATRKSTKNWEVKIDEWAPQGMSYLRAMLKRKLAKAPIVLWRVWFMCGDWSFESKGDLTLLRDYWDIAVEFDKRALEEHWQKVVAAGKKYGLLKDAPAQDMPRSWKKLEKTCQKQPTASPKKSLGKTPPTSPRTARVLTFRPMKKS